MDSIIHHVLVVSNYRGGAVSVVAQSQPEGKCDAYKPAAANNFVCPEGHVIETLYVRRDDHRAMHLLDQRDAHDS